MNQILVLSILFVFSLVSCTVTSVIPTAFATTDDEEEKEEEVEEEEVEEEEVEEEEVEEEEDIEDTDIDPFATTTVRGQSVDPSDVNHDKIDADDIMGQIESVIPDDIKMDDRSTDRIDSDDVETSTIVGEISSNTRGIDPVPQISNARMIAMDLSRLTPSEIGSYPTSQLSSSDLDSAFQYLNSDNLAKVLLNTPLDDLRIIEGKLTPPAFEEILDGLHEPDRTEVPK